MSKDIFFQDNADPFIKDLKLFIKELHEKSFTFILIGIICEFFIIIDPHLAKDGMLYSYFNYAHISIDLSKLANNIIEEHMATKTISCLIVFLMVFSSINRIIFGCDCSNESKFDKCLITPLSDFVLSLNGALLGLFLGLTIMCSLDIFIGNESLKNVFILLFGCTIPYLLSGFVFISRQILYKRLYLGKYFLGKVGDSIEGILLLIIAILLLTYNEQIVKIYQIITP